MAKSKTAGKKNMTGAHRGSVKKYAYGGKVGDPQRIGRTEPVRGVSVSRSSPGVNKYGTMTVPGGRGVTAYQSKTKPSVITRTSTSITRPSNSITAGSFGGLSKDRKTPSFASKDAYNRQSPSRPSRSSSPSTGTSSSRSSQTPAQKAQAARRAERNSP